MNINIPNNSNVAYVLKYLGIPTFFLILAVFGGFKDLPIELAFMLGLILLAMEVSMIPYDIGNAVKDDVHPYEHEVVIFTTGRKWSSKRAIRFYGKNGLSFCIFFERLTLFIWLSAILPIIFLVVKAINS